MSPDRVAEDAVSMDGSAAIKETRARARETVELAPSPLAGRDGAALTVGDAAARVSVTPRAAIEGDPTIVVDPVAQKEHAFGISLDGVPTPVRLDWIDDHRAVLVRGAGDDATRTPVLLGAVRRTREGSAVREVVVGGWRFEIAVESERRAQLRERSRRAGRAATGSGRLEIRAIIPGRIVAVSVAAGDPVIAGQQLLVLEAMKMQNELRAPREGTISSVAVSVGTNVEVGDVLMVME